MKNKLVNKSYFKVCILLFILFGVLLLNVSIASASAIKNIKGNHTKTAILKLKSSKGDRVKFKPYSDKYLGIYVNEDLALTIDIGESYQYYTIQYFTISGKKFIHVICGYDGNGIAHDAIYKYYSKTNRFLKVCDFSNVSWNWDGLITKVSSNEISIRCITQPSITGLVTWNYVYRYIGGKFKLKSQIASVKSYLPTISSRDSKYIRLMKKNQFVACKKLSFYKNTNMKSLSFTVKKDETVKLHKIKIIGNTIFLQFKYKNKYGWVKPQPSDYFKRWFYGVYYAN